MVVKKIFSQKIKEEEGWHLLIKINIRYKGFFNITQLIFPIFTQINWFCYYFSSCYQMNLTILNYQKKAFVHYIYVYIYISLSFTSWCICRAVFMFWVCISIVLNFNKWRFHWLLKNICKRHIYNTLVVVVPNFLGRVAHNKTFGFYFKCPAQISLFNNTKYRIETLHKCLLNISKFHRFASVELQKSI